MPDISSADAMRRLGAWHDHLPAGVVVHAADGRIVFANRLAQDLLGRTEAQLLAIAPERADWVLRRDDGSPLPPEELPVNVVLRTGRNVSGQVTGVMVGDAMRWLLCNTFRNTMPPAQWSKSSCASPIAPV